MYRIDRQLAHGGYLIIIIIIIGPEGHLLAYCASRLSSSKFQGQLPTMKQIKIYNKTT